MLALPALLSNLLGCANGQPTVSGTPALIRYGEPISAQLEHPVIDAELITIAHSADLAVEVGRVFVACPDDDPSARELRSHASLEDACTVEIPAGSACSIRVDGKVRRITVASGKPSVWLTIKRETKETDQRGNR